MERLKIAAIKEATDYMRMKYGHIVLKTSKRYY